MKKILVPLLFLIAILAGCGLANQSRNNSNIVDIRVGQTEEQLIAIMGKPQVTRGSGSKLYFLYTTNAGYSDQYNRYTPILLVNGKVEGWGKQYFKEIGVLPPTPESTSQSSSGGGGGLIVAAPLYNPPNMAPFMTNPNTLAPVRGNTQPFIETPPPFQVQNPSVNCNPNGTGGFRCQ